MKIEIKYPALCFLLLFGVQLLCASNGVGTDSTKNKVSINDPRNPDCPCHKHQKEADKEYAQLLQKNDEHKLNAEATSNTFSNTKKIKPGYSFKLFFSTKRNRKNKVVKKKCFRDKLSRCFHF
jgi:hypothetical protein